MTRADRAFRDRIALALYLAMVNRRSQLGAQMRSAFEEANEFLWQRALIDGPEEAILRNGGRVIEDAGGPATACVGGYRTHWWVGHDTCQRPGCLARRATTELQASRTRNRKFHGRKIQIVPPKAELAS